MGAPKGNQNAAKEQRDWAAAIRRHTKQNPEKLRLLAEKVYECAMDGQAWAVTEIGNRLDGKPVQQVDMSGDLNLTRTLRDLTDEELLRIATQHAAHDADTDGQTVQ